MMESAHPQTVINNIGKNCCLVACYLYCMGIDPDNDLEYYRLTRDAIKAGVKVSGIDWDCTVLNPVAFYKWVSGREVTVTKKTIVSIKDIVKPTPVRFYYIDEDGKSHDHFVVVEGGMVVFDPTLDSRSVAIGHPDSARIIEYI